MKARINSKVPNPNEFFKYYEIYNIESPLKAQEQFILKRLEILKIHKLEDYISYRNSRLGGLSVEEFFNETVETTIYRV